MFAPHRKNILQEETCENARRYKAAIVKTQPDDYIEILEVRSSVAFIWHGLCSG